MGKTQGGLTKWFKEDWRDVKTGKKCGRSGKEKKSRPYPQFSFNNSQAS